MGRFSTPAPGSFPNYHNNSHTCSTVVFPVAGQAPLQRLFRYEEVVPTGILRWNASNNYTTAHYCTMAIARPDKLMETFYVGIIVLFLAMVFILLRTCTSMHASKWDIFRLVTIMNLGTLPVLILILTTATLGFGFNRFEGFGILTHNLSEIVFFTAFWHGADSRRFRSFAVTGGVIFLFTELALIAVLPLDYLLLVLAAIGATCDYLILYTFIYLAYLARYLMFFKDPKIPWVSYNGYFLTYGVCGSLLHVITVILLFVGVILCQLKLILAAISLLIVTFASYTVLGDEDSPTHGTVICGIPKTGSVSTQNHILQELVILSHRKRKYAGYELKQRSSSDLYASHVSPFAGETPQLSQIRYQQERFGSGTPEDYVKMPGSMSYIPGRGICSVFPESRRVSTFSNYCRVILLSAVSGLVTALCTWFSPCWVDTSKLYGCID